MAIETTDDTATHWHGTEGDPVVVLAHDWNGRLPWIDELAERYLAAERYSLTDVSEMLGFTAPSAFSRWFRQRFGVSPTQWRADAQRTARAARSGSRGDPLP